MSDLRERLYAWSLLEAHENRAVAHKAKVITVSKCAYHEIHRASESGRTETGDKIAHVKVT